MADIDDVLERLVTDPEFKAQLARDPATALAGYDLTADDLALLAAPAGNPGGGLGAVEQRTSKSGFFGMLSGVVESTHAGAGTDAAPRMAAGDLTSGDANPPEPAIKNSYPIKWAGAPVTDTGGTQSGGGPHVRVFHTSSPEADGQGGVSVAAPASA